MGKVFVKDLATKLDGDAVSAAVEDYLVANPPVADEPQLAAHILDPTPHPAYDNLAAGRFTTYLENGLA